MWRGLQQSSRGAENGAGVASWVEQPNTEALKALLQRADVPADAVERVMRLCAAQRVVRWNDVDRARARRALRRLRGVKP